MTNPYLCVVESLGTGDEPRPYNVLVGANECVIVRPRVGISACLLGQEVRWDGRHKLDAPLVLALAARLELVAVCPEVELGLGVPREPIRLERRAGELRLVAFESGCDLTERMASFARDRARELARLGIAGFVLKARSPSCGKERVLVTTEAGEEPAGRGFFAEALVAALPDLPIEEETGLADPSARERFFERVLAYATKPPSSRRR